MKKAPRLLAWWLKKIGMVAITLPPLGIYALEEFLVDDRLRKHENTHWEQYKRMGLFKFYGLYLWYSLKHGYQNNPMEIEARVSEQV